MHKKFYSSQRLKINRKYLIFPTVKLTANYASVDRVGVGSLMQIFNKFHLFKIPEILKILLWNINNSKSVKKRKKIMFNKIFQKKRSHLL